MKNFKELMNEEHSGFAVTLEVIASLIMIFVFISFTLYFLRVMNVQRFMNTVMTSTATQAARWGGTNSDAYRANVGGEPLLTVAQNQLNQIAGDFNPIISGTPHSISYDGQEITINIRYHLPPAFSTYSSNMGFGNSIGNDIYNKTRDMNMGVKVRSIMRAGELL